MNPKKEPLKGATRKLLELAQEEIKKIDASGDKTRQEELMQLKKFEKWAKKRLGIKNENTK